MYKLINKLAPPIMNGVFKLNSDIRYNMRQILQFFAISQDREYFLPLTKNMGYPPDDYKTVGNLDIF